MFWNRRNKCGSSGMQINRNLSLKGTVERTQNLRFSGKSVMDSYIFFFSQGTNLHVFKWQGSEPGTDETIVEVNYNTQKFQETVYYIIQGHKSIWENKEYLQRFVPQYDSGQLCCWHWYIITETEIHQTLHTLLAVWRQQGTILNDRLNIISLVIFQLKVKVLFIKQYFIQHWNQLRTTLLGSMFILQLHLYLYISQWCLYCKHNRMLCVKIKYLYLHKQNYQIQLMS